ncbi:helix-turn-helix transcriptional regulator [Kangiella spongicola]|uniref:Transcriptional regulator n=1 Tax=Kangiella spongicola TaxID=796379 RepID=A0A318D802_9GAMM|nr:helix-turn-helix transcriptional regulator [Kangiella spongicola]PXF64045.1 transcriptional regulator [Kangiella spongicola]
MAKQIPIDNNIKTLRFLTGEMTQQELAEQLGVTRQTVAAIEQRKYSPSLEVAFKISKIFGKSLNEIFTYEES